MIETIIALFALTNVIASAVIPIILHVEHSMQNCEDLLEEMDEVLQQVWPIPFILPLIVAAYGIGIFADWPAE